MEEKTSLMGTRRIARAAVLLALTAALQASGRYLTPFLGPANIFVIGALVNACLFIAVEYTGLWGATTIALAVPFTAVLTGAPVPLPFIPIIGVGNFLLVLIFYLLKRSVPGIAVGAVVKFSFLFSAVALFLHLKSLPPALEAALYFTFSWPQLITALLGGALYYAIRKVLKIEPVGK